MITKDQYNEIKAALDKLEDTIDRAFFEATSAIEATFSKFEIDCGCPAFGCTCKEPVEACGTCDGTGEIPVLEHHSGPNLPPGGYDDVGDETRPCPDCKLKEAK